MFLLILAFLIVTFIAIPIITQKYREHKVLKEEAKEKGLKVVPKKKKVSDRNGTRQDVTEFISRLISFARRYKVRTIIPATFVYNGEESRISTMLVGHGRVIGMFLLGFGGSIQPDPEKDEWRQKLNGEFKYFSNPLKITEGMDKQVHEALESKGMGDVPYKTVCVFTTPDVDIDPMIQDVYNVKGFFYYLESVEWVRKGDLDINAVADTILSFVPMDEIKEAQKEHDKAVKEAEAQARADEKEAKKEKKS